MRNGFLTQISTVQNNYGYDLNFTLTDSTGAVVDVTNASLQFRAQLNSTIPVQFTGAMVKDNGALGTCHYTVAQGDFPTPGQWNCQIVATFAGEVLTFTGIIVSVDPQLPIS